MARQLRFALTAYDPNPTEVTLSMSGDSCTIEKCAQGNISVEDYKVDADGNPFEIYLKVTPEPIAFIMRFIDGQMTIEFKGNWSAFKTEMQNMNIKQQEIEIVQEQKPQEIASSILSFKIHLKDTDVDPMLLQLNWKAPLIEAIGGEGNYKVVFQRDVPEGREFCVTMTHPDGDIYVIRFVIKNDQITILGTDLYDEAQHDNYLSFYINDEEKIGAINKQIEDNPDQSKIGILCSHECYSEAVSLGSLVPYVCHMDSDGNQIPKVQKDDDPAVKRGREAREKAAAAGKKGTEPPNDGKDWSCGDLLLPPDDLHSRKSGFLEWRRKMEQEKLVKHIGRLSIPEFNTNGVVESHLRDVGKLNFTGFKDEVKSVKRSGPKKVGKLNLTKFTEVRT